MKKAIVFLIGLNFLLFFILFFTRIISKITGWFEFPKIGVYILLSSITSIVVLKIIAKIVYKIPITANPLNFDKY